MADELELSIAAGHVVSSALEHTRNLFCPFCAASFLFEFTLKDHLKADHRDDIVAHLLGKADARGDDADDDLLSLSVQHCQHSCPFCNAAFNHLGLIPKHIGDYHGGELLQVWQQQTGNAERLKAAKASEPSILYAACSPGLSAIFKQMATDDDTHPYGNGAALAVSPKLKSILKKTPSAVRCTQPPATPQLAPGVTIRRSKSDVVKRSLSVRRELRFDPTTKRSPVTSAVAALSPRMGVKKKTSTFKLLRNPFSFARHSVRQTPGKMPLTTANQLITSTPIGLLDDVGTLDHRGRSQLDNWKSSVRNVVAISPRTRHRLRHAHGRQPSCAESAAPDAMEHRRFQCAHCKQAWPNNADLLMHLREQHRGIKHWLRPQYGCTTCGTTFYSNNSLIRHCHVEHSVLARATMLGRRHSMR